MQAKIRNDLQNSSPTGSVPKFVSITFNLYVLLGVERRLWMMMSRPSHGIPNPMLTCCGVVVIDLCCDRSINGTQLHNFQVVNCKIHFIILCNLI